MLALPINRADLDDEIDEPLFVERADRLDARTLYDEWILTVVDEAGDRWPRQGPTMRQQHAERWERLEAAARRRGDVVKAWSASLRIDGGRSRWHARRLRRRS